MLVELMPSSQTGNVTAKRISCVCQLLSVVGHVFAGIDYMFLVPFVGELVEVTSTSSLPAGTQTRVAKQQDICRTSWQPRMVLTVQGEVVNQAVEVRCTTMGGAQTCSFNMLASAKLADLQAI